MAGEQKRKTRAVLVTKALLLGYTIERIPGGNSWMVLTPSGAKLTIRERADTPYLVGVFNVPWEAARHALIHAGVIDAALTRRDTGVGSSKNFRLRSRRPFRRRVPRVVKSSWSRP